MSEPARLVRLGMATYLLGSAACYVLLDGGRGASVADYVLSALVVWLTTILVMVLAAPQLHLDKRGMPAVARTRQSEAHDVDPAVDERSAERTS